MSNSGEIDNLAVLRARLRAVIGTDNGIVITDPNLPDNPIVYVNEGFLKMTGYAEREVLGRNCRFLQGPDSDPNAIKAMHDAVLGHTSCQVALINYRKNGTPYWNHSAITPISDAKTGKLTHFVSIQSDVSDQKKAENELRLRERAVAAASNGIIICDARSPKMPIVYCNAAFEKMTGYAASEVAGRNCRFLQGADTDPSAREAIRDALQTGRDCLVVIKNYRKNGVPFWNELSLSPVRDGAGRLTHYIGVQTDITQFRQTEEENARLINEVQNAAAQQRAFLRDILRSVTEGRLHLCETVGDLPDPLPLVHGPQELTMPGLRTFRHAAERAAVHANLPDERWQDFVAGVGEVSMNAVVHARDGIGEVRAEPGRVQVWVRDSGEGIALDSIHKATIIRGYTTAGTMGHGFWLMLKTCDACWLLTGPEGTTVVLEQSEKPPLAPWLSHLL